MSSLIPIIPALRDDFKKRLDKRSEVQKVAPNYLRYKTHLDKHSPEVVVIQPYYKMFYPANHSSTRTEDYGRFTLSVTNAGCIRLSVDWPLPVPDKLVTLVGPDGQKFDKECWSNFLEYLRGVSEPGGQMAQLVANMLVSWTYLSHIEYLGPPKYEDYNQFSIGPVRLEFADDFVRIDISLLVIREPVYETRRYVYEYPYPQGVKDPAGELTSQLRQMLSVLRDYHSPSGGYRLLEQELQELELITGSSSG